MEHMQGLTVRPESEWASTGFVKREMPKPSLDEVKNPADAEWVIVKPHFTGVCGSDRGIWYRQAWGERMKESLEKEGKDIRIIGHEMFGEIVEIGSKVAEKFGYSVGQMVAAESHVTCGKCYQCQHGEKEVCVDELIMGISIDGCFAEYVKLPANVLWPTNTDLIRPEIAAMQEPFGNAVHACSKVDYKDKSIAILGCGPIGLFSVLIAKALGARQIIAVDPSEKNRLLAKQFGADAVLSTVSPEDSPHDPQLVAEIMKLTNGVGVDVAMEMAGFHTSVHNAIQSVRRGGHVILFGLKSGELNIPSFDRLIARGITLHGIIGRQVFQTWETTKALLEDTSNNIQKHLWEGLLQEGKNGTIINFSEYTPETFEAGMKDHPKIIIRF